MEKRNSKKNAVEIPDVRTKRLRAAFFVVISLLLLALAVGMLIGLHKLMFKANPRLVFRELHVSSTGYWNKKDDFITRILKLKKNTNIFEIDLKQLRQKLRTIPSVEDAEVVRILPDTIYVNITERMPRALINYSNAKWVIDENTVVMERRFSMASQLSLPLLVGVPSRRFSGGSRLPELKPALDLIGKILRNFPDMELLRLSVATPEKLDFHIRYRNGKIYRVIIPVKNRGLDFMLNALQSAIIHAYQLGDMRSTFNLSFDGQVVIN